MRAFVAVELSDEVRLGLVDLQEDLKRSGADVKWVEPANLHVTVKFLGQVEEPAEQHVREAMCEAVRGVAPFVLAIGGAGSFPGGSRPRVVWVGAHEAGRSLETIHRRLERGLSALGVAPDGRRFVPHVTLGRVRSGKGVGRLARRIAAAAERSFGAVTVEALTLFESRLTPAGPIYSVRHRALLAPPGRVKDAAGNR